MFTIAKLRSSGSDISKLQEVGRGLRLPVDECGNRISNEEFTLNYIVDFTEADFAKKLVDQINSEVPESVTLSLNMVQQVAQKMGADVNKLVVELLNNNYVDFQYNIIPENKVAFFEKYPLFKSGLESGKVKDRNTKPNHPVKIIKARFEELRDLWEKLNQRYTIWYETQLDCEIDGALDNILASGNIFSERIISSRRDIVKSNGEQMASSMENGVQYAVNRALPYGIFLKRIAEKTDISLDKIHRAVCRYVNKHGKFKDSYFNEQSISALVQAFTDWKIEVLQGRFKYKRTKGSIGATALTYADGSVREEIVQGRIGTKIKEGEAADKYLYDTKAYDSPLELEDIESDIDGGLSGIAEVIVYGKIPRRSIAIPTIAGGSYSPDFMYVVRKTNGEKELNIVVETKDVENKSTLRGIEDAK